MAARLVDDTDSQIRYVGVWETIIGDSNESNSTAHGTNAIGNQAIFIFHGSSIAVYGTIRNGIDSNDSASTPISTYTVDNASPTLYSGTPNDTILYNQLFYRSPILDCGRETEHTLAITFISGSERKLWLDYFQVVGCTNVPSTVTSNQIEPSIVSTSLQSMEKEKAALLKIILGTAIGSSIVIIAILFYISYRYRAKVRLFYSRPTARHSGVLSRRPAIRPFRLRTSTSPIIAPFYDVRSDTAPLNAPQDMHNHPPSHNQPHLSLVSSNNSRPSRSGFTTRGGSFAYKCERIDGRAVASSDSNRHFISTSSLIPGPSDATRPEIETVNGGPPPAYRPISLRID